MTKSAFSPSFSPLVDGGLREFRTNEEVVELVAELTEHGATKWEFHNFHVANMAEFRLRGWIPSEEIRFFHATPYAFVFFSAPHHCPMVVIRTPPTGHSFTHLRVSLPQLLAVMTPKITKQFMLICDNNVRDEACWILADSSLGHFENIAKSDGYVFYHNEAQHKYLTEMEVPEPEESFELRSLDALTEEQLQFVYDQWRWSKFEGVEANKIRLSRLPSLGMFVKESNELIGLTRSHESGMLSHAFMKSEHRGTDRMPCLVLSMFQKWARAGLHVFMTTSVSALAENAARMTEFHTRLVDNNVEPLQWSINLMQITGSKL